MEIEEKIEEKIEKDGMNAVESHENTE